MANEQYFSSFKRHYFSDGTYEDVPTAYGSVLRWGRTQRATDNELDARERFDAHNLQNTILDDLLKEANIFETLSGKLVDLAGFDGPVSRKEAKELRDSIRDVKDVIDRFLRPR